MVWTCRNVDCVLHLLLGELGATLLVAPPGESTLPVRVYTLIANTPLSEVASLALLQVSITLLPLVLLALLFRKRKTEMA